MIFAPMVINLLGYKVNVFDNGSNMTVGPSQTIDQFLSYKRNYGFGESNGDLTLVNLPFSAVADQDLSDSNSVKNSLI